KSLPPILIGSPAPPKTKKLCLVKDTNISLFSENWSKLTFDRIFSNVTAMTGVRKEYKGKLDRWLVFT
ncbi:MAG: hypothetical protein ACFFBD_26850, partial [Candidatus Hodarchaeota archaeon]